MKDTLDKLSDKLIEIINNKTNPFQKINVIVPSISLFNYFKAYWLKNNKIDVLMNVFFYTTDEYINSLIDKDKRLLTNDLIVLYILKELNENNINYPNLKKYYNNNSNKLYDLSTILSSLYLEYEDDLYNYNETNSIYKEDELNLFEKIESEALKNNIISKLKFIDTINRSTDINVFYGFNKYTKLEEKLINKLEISDSNNLILDIKDNTINNLKIITAPSKLREIEGIHTEICKILLDSNNTYSDILVLSNNISEYKTIIRQVFHADNLDYPSITRSINNSSDIESDTYKVLNKLKEIAKKEYYSSLDFIDLLSNKLIKKNYGITDDDINIIKDTLVQLNVRRENTKSNIIKDFSYLKTRVLMNEIIDINIIDNNIININNLDYIPYSSISLSNELSSIIIDLIDNLNNFIEFYKNNKMINKSNMDSFIDIISCFLSCKDSFNGEKNSSYTELLNYIDNYKLIINNDLSIDIFIDYLKDTSIIKGGINNKYYLNGITFANFDRLALLEAKYIFLLGYDNNSFNTNISISELDIRDHNLLKENYKEELENSFTFQANLASKKVFISYVNKDLKTDEEIFPSNLIDNITNIKEGILLKDYINKYINSEEYYEDIPLDETRKNDKLFTKREVINKDYYNELRGISCKDETSPKTENDNNDQNNTLNNQDNIKIIPIKLKDIRDFLDEPYSYYVNKLFGKEDETDSILNNEFEALDIDNLTSYSIVKDIIVENYNNGDVDKVKEKYSLLNKIPLINDFIKDKTFKKEIEKSASLLNNKANYQVKLFDDLLIDKYLIKISNEILISEDSTNNSISLALIKSNTNKFKDYLELYLYSLVYVLTKSDSNQYSINLDCEYENPIINNYVISYKKAYSNLIGIIDMMNDSINDLKFFKYDKISEDIETNEFNYTNYDPFNNHGDYEYFRFKKLLNKYDIRGLSDKCTIETIKKYKELYEKYISCDEA